MITENMEKLLVILGFKDIKQLLDEEREVRKYAVPCRTEESWEVYNFPVYCVVRALKPELCIETGVAGGQTSCAILTALKRNRRGFLYSIDPAYKPSRWYMVEPGERIPKHLVDRWRFIKGTTRKALPNLVKNIKENGWKVDFFFHDSEHTKENILFEFRSVKEVASSNCIFGIHDRHPPEIEEEFKFLGGDPPPRFRAFGLGENYG